MKFIYIFLLIFFSYSSLASKCYEIFGRMGTSVHLGQPHQGVAKAYSHLEKNGFWKTVKGQDFGDLSVKGFFNRDIVHTYEEIFQKTSDIIKKGFRPALIGGDHSQSFATISALKQHHPNLKVLWVDAHTDINTRDTSSSNNTHGMPVAGLMGVMAPELWNQKWIIQELLPKDIVYVGIRDVDEGEKKLVKKHDIENYSVEIIREKGIEKILLGIKEKWKGAPVHLSFDIDALDHSLVPATGTPVSKGLTIKEALKIIEIMGSDFVSFELVEFNPDLAQTKQELIRTEKSVEVILSRLFDLSN